MEAIADDDVLQRVEVVVVVGITTKAWVIDAIPTVIAKMAKPILRNIIMSRETTPMMI